MGAGPSTQANTNNNNYDLVQSIDKLFDLFGDDLQSATTVFIFLLEIDFFRRHKKKMPLISPETTTLIKLSNEYPKEQLKQILKNITCDYQRLSFEILSTYYCIITEDSAYDFLRLNWENPSLGTVLHASLSDTCYFLSFEQNILRLDPVPLLINKDETVRVFPHTGESYVKDTFQLALESLVPKSRRKPLFTKKLIDPNFTIPFLIEKTILKHKVKKSFNKKLSNNFKDIWGKLENDFFKPLLGEVSAFEQSWNQFYFQLDQYLKNKHNDKIEVSQAELIADYLLKTLYVDLKSIIPKDELIFLISLSITDNNKFDFFLAFQQITNLLRTLAKEFVANLIAGKLSETKYPGKKVLDILQTFDRAIRAGLLGPEDNLKLHLAVKAFRIFYTEDETKQNKLIIDLIDKTAPLSRQDITVIIADIAQKIAMMGPLSSQNSNVPQPQPELSPPALAALRFSLLCAQETAELSHLVIKLGRQFLLNIFDEKQSLTEKEFWYLVKKAFPEEIWLYKFFNSYKTKSLKLTENEILAFLKDITQNCLKIKKSEILKSYGFEALCHTIAMTKDTTTLSKLMISLRDHLKISNFKNASLKQRFEKFKYDLELHISQNSTKQEPPSLSSHHNNAGTLITQNNSKIWLEEEKEYDPSQPDKNNEEENLEGLPSKT